MQAETLKCIKDERIGESTFAKRKLDKKDKLNVCRWFAKVEIFRARKTKV